MLYCDILTSLDNTLGDVLQMTWPMLFISMVLIASVRIAYLYKRKEEFVLHKDKFIKYLNEFIQELQHHSRRIEQILMKNISLVEECILEKVVQSELDIPHALLEFHGNLESSIRENVFGKWNSLKSWFIDSQGYECECRKVLRITNDVIRSIIQNAALIVQLQNWGISRKDDYRKFLELFLKCEDLEEAHRLSAHVLEYKKYNILK